MKEKFVKAYLKTASIFAGLSQAKRLQVGAIIVKDDRIISIGFNGTPSGWDNCCEYEEYAHDSRVADESSDWQFDPVTNRYSRLKTKSEVLHAERNALDKLAKQGGIGGDGSTMFCTHAPCLECAKSIYGAGIKYVYYETKYRDDAGLRFLEKSGVSVTQVLKE